MKGFGSLVLFMLCASLLLTGCAKKAADEGKIPITTASDEARKEFLEGRSLAEKMLITNSISHFDKAIAMDSTFAIALFARANASFTGTDFFAYLTRAVAASSHASDGERLLISANEANANGNLDDQKANLEKLVSLYPKDERAHFALGGYYFQVQDYPNAIDQYKQSIAIDSNYTPVYNILGYAYRQVGNYSEAEKAFKKYTQLIPGDPNPYDSYAELLMKMGRFDESIDNYQKALTNDPTFFNSRMGIAADYLYKGMQDKASAEMQKLTSMARNDGELRAALFTQMVIDADAGHLDRALADADKQYALGEKTHDVSSMSADLASKGNILLEMNKPDEALKAFEKSAELIASSDLSPRLKDRAALILHYNRAEVALAKNDMKTAKAEADEFRTGAASSKNITLQRLDHQLNGRMALSRKDHETAINELLQANLQDPYDIYRLALAYQGKGDKTKAKEYYEKATHFNGLPALNYAFIRMRAQKMLAAS